MLVLNQCVLKQSTGGYDPAELFQGGTYKGFWIDASATSTLKQNSNGTTDVAADGDPVGYVAEKSGAGGLLTQAASGQRPLYKIVNGKPCLRFDGSDDMLAGDATVRAMTSSAPGFTMFIVMQPTSSGSSYGQHIWRTQAASSQEVCNAYMLSATSTRVASVSGNSDLTITTDDLKIYTWRYNAGGATVTVRKNGVAQSPSNSWSSLTVNAGTGGKVNLSDTEFANAFKGDIYQALYINYVVSDDDCAKVEPVLAALAGVTI